MIHLTETIGSHICVTMQKRYPPLNGLQQVELECILKIAITPDNTYCLLLLHIVSLYLYHTIWNLLAILIKTNIT